MDTILLLDIGAAITLLQQEVWARITVPTDLRPWSRTTLVSAVVVQALGGKKFQTHFVVVSPLTSGIDFLQDKIDLGCKTLCLQESGCDILLDRPAPVQAFHSEQHVRTLNTVEVPRSAMVIPAY